MVLYLDAGTAGFPPQRINIDASTCRLSHIEYVGIQNEVTYLLDRSPRNYGNKMAQLSYIYRFAVQSYLKYVTTWDSYQTRNIAGCACAGNVFPRHRLQRKPLVSDPGMHHGTCATHVPWSMSGSLTRGGGENVPGIPGACATRNFTYLVRGPCVLISSYSVFVRNTWNQEYKHASHRTRRQVQCARLSRANFTWANTWCFWRIMMWKRL